MKTYALLLIIVLIIIIIPVIVFLTTAPAVTSPTAASNSSTPSTSTPSTSTPTTTQKVSPIPIPTTVKLAPTTQDITPIIPVPKQSIDIRFINKEIKTRINNSKCIDIPNGTTNDTYLQLYDCKGISSQEWTYDNIDTKSIKSTLTGKCIDFEAATNTVNQRNCNGSKNQQWALSGERIQNMYNTDMCINAAGGGGNNGDRIIGYRCNDDGPNEHWYFNTAGGTASQTPVPVPVPVILTPTPTSISVTAPTPAPAPAPAQQQNADGCSTYINGGLCADLMSPSGNCRVSLQDDGNLVMYGLRDPNNLKVIWTSNTPNNGQFSKPFRLNLQSDSNLVLYDANGKVVWATNTSGTGGIRTQLGSDCNFVMYDANNNNKWSTNTFY